MDNYTGKIRFYKNIKVNYMVTEHGNSTYYDDSSDHVFVGESEIINVKLITDTRSEEIDLIEAEVKKRGIEHQVWLDTMSGKIQSLRAIEAPK